MGGKVWTPAEESRLREMWGDACQRALREAFRDRCWGAIYARATHLGLPHGIPQGHVTIPGAARLGGFEPRSILGILRAFGAQIRTSYAYPYRDGPRVNHAPRYVDEMVVRDAVAWWARTESGRAAAARYGVSAPALIERLRRAGKLPPRLGGRRFGYRIEPSVVDEVMAADPISRVTGRGARWVDRRTAA